MKPWYRTILGFTSIIVIGLSILLTIYVLFIDRQFTSQLLILGAFHGIIYFLLHLLLEFSLTKLFSGFKLIVINISRIVVSLILLPVPFLIYKSFANPDSKTDNQIVYILPNDYRGKITILFKSSSKNSNVVIITDTAIIYNVPPKGIFNSPLPYIRSTSFNATSFYIQLPSGLSKVRHSKLPFALKDSIITVYECDYNDNIFHSRNSITYVIDYPTNLYKYNELNPIEL